ncbi:G-protein beta WD- 40 repeats containing protein [Penicillium malachiteum]|nr:G-protein beta WD- 40 repeats containing protein [Penicillium malachiteum]
MKWLLTSRPFDSTEQELFTSHDQFHVNLELNSTHVSDAVDAYITSKGQLEAELAAKAQGTFLWVSLVCKELEKLKNPHSTEVLSTIQHLPVGLYPFYDRMFDQIKTGNPNDVFKCMRLLQVMMLAYRPLTVQGIIRLTDLFDEHHDNPIISVVDRCASFINIQEDSIQFVHQSAPGKDLDNDFGHGQVAHICLLHLTNSLHHNLLDLQRPDSTKDPWKEVADRGQTTVLVMLDYAASFWVQHLGNAGTTKEKDEVDTFLRTKFLEWLECLSWLDMLPQALEALQILARVEKIYSSTIIFSPKSSFVQEQNLDKMPRWIRKISPTEDTWTSLVRTIAGHSHRVCTIAFSPDGNTIASGSDDKTIKIWDATTGKCQETLDDRSSTVQTLVFTPDGKMIASGSHNKNAVIWDCQRKLNGHASEITALAFSPDGNMIASGSSDQTIKLWDSTTGDCLRTLCGHSNWVDVTAGCCQDTLPTNTPTLSSDGNITAPGSEKPDNIWHSMISGGQGPLAGPFSRVSAMAISLDARWIACAGISRLLIWDAITGDLSQRKKCILNYHRCCLLSKQEANRVWRDFWVPRALP